MLIGSSPGATDTFPPVQARAQFSLWALMASPLLIGAHVANLSAWDLATYSNAAVIAVNQDVR